MRLLAATVVLAGCSFEIAARGDSGPDPIDAPPDAYVAPGPRVLPGGGIADAPVVDTVHVHVLDRMTRTRIADAEVDVAGTTGTTSEDGLFTARGAFGDKVTVVVTKAGYRAEAWVGVRGANVTIALEPVPVPAPPFATVTGTIGGFGAYMVGPGHYVLGVVGYGQDDLAMEAVNNIGTPNRTHVCVAPSCAYTVRTRTGQVALLARVVDVDTKNTGNTQDDTASTIGYAYATGLSLASDATQADVTLTRVATNQMVTIDAAFDPLPAGMTVGYSFVGIDFGAGGVTYLGDFPTTTSPSIRGPTLAGIPGAAAYRFAAIAGSTAGAPGSIVIRRGVTSLPLATGAWPEPPTGVTASRTEVRFTPSPDGRYHSVEVEVPGDAGYDVLNVLVFDDTTTIALPPAVALPAGTVRVTVGARRTTLDVADFSFDADGDLLDGIAVAGVVDVAPAPP